MRNSLSAITTRSFINVNTEAALASCMDLDGLLLPYIQCNIGNVEKFLI